MSDPGEDSAHGSSTGTGNNSRTNAESEASRTSLWASRQRKAIKSLKYLVFLALGLAAVACGYYTYVLTKREEHQQFEQSVS